ncbi:unnamed protein product [Echinostoma caproni]|uniref:RH1 domain-containing protein n=1 Tax=Echinostoma caproni TaxID=27848 RepID=A0A183ABQ0_9TREM|nr:unnamed protein product [Echinostoma caproni]
MNYVGSASHAVLDVLKNDGPDETGKQHVLTRPLIEVMEDVKSKLRLIDGETKSFYENSYRYLREAKNEAHKLRERNNDLRTKLAEYEKLQGQVRDHEYLAKPNERVLNTEFSNQVCFSSPMFKIPQICSRTF